MSHEPHGMLHRALCTQVERAVRTAYTYEVGTTADEIAEAYCHEVAWAHDGELRHSEREGLPHVSLSLPYV